MKGPIPDLDDVQLLREERRRALDALELAANISSFPTSMNQLDGPEAILRETAFRCETLLPFKATAFYLVNEDDADFNLSYYTPKEYKNKFLQAFEKLVDYGTVAWVLQYNRPHVASITALGKKSPQYVLLHSLATPSRIRGLFIALPETDWIQSDNVSLHLLSIVLQSCAQMIESQALYAVLRNDSKAMQKRLTESRKIRNDNDSECKDLRSKIIYLKNDITQNKMHQAEQHELLVESRKEQENFRSRTSLLLKTCIHLAKELDFNSLAKNVLTSSLQFLDCFHGSVWLFSDNNLPEKVIVFPLEQHTNEHIGFFADDAHPWKECMIKNSFSGEVTTGYSPKNKIAGFWLYLPLLVSGEPKGCMILQGRSHPFLADEKENVVLLADVLATSLA